MKKNLNEKLTKFKNHLKTSFVVLPASIRYDKKSAFTDKLLYAVLVMLSNSLNYAYPTNRYLSFLLDSPEITIRKTLDRLKENKYIYVLFNKKGREIHCLKSDLNEKRFKNKTDIDVTALNNTPTYYAFIPGRVLLDNRINSTEKILYTEIMALTNKYGFAFATNSYLGELLDLSTRQIARALESLRSLNYIKYGSDLKNKRLLYLMFNKSLDHTYIKKSNPDYEIIESSANDYTLYKNMPLDPEVSEALDELFKKM